MGERTSPGQEIVLVQRRSQWRGTRVPRWAARLSGWLARWYLRARRLWRQSLQFRVVAITVVLCILVMVVIQNLVFRRIAHDMVDTRIDQAQYVSRENTTKLQRQLNATDKNDPQAYLQVALDALSSVRRDSGDNSVMGVLVRGPRATAADRSTEYSSGVSASAIPEELRRTVTEHAGRMQYHQVAPVSVGGVETTSVIVGSQIVIPQVGTYQLYYVYPMNREQQTLNTVYRTFMIGSLIFVVLIGLVAYVVTWMVVNPVREAAVVSQRLASGRLNERMRVSGEDDLAVLATSFNAMADHLQAQIRQLEDLSTVQQRFASDVSHELRTPLTTIQMASAMIYEERQELSPAACRSSELLNTEVDRFYLLLTDLLEISRFDAGAAVLDREDQDLSQVVTSVVRATEHIAEERGTPLVVRGTDTSHVCPMDSRRIERVIRNLIINAIEHGEKRPVEITVASNSSAVAVTVVDRGVGLRPGEAELVFNRFWRADPARKRTMGGTGLGLAISQEDVRLHDGWLQAWGTVGVGACFRMTLPKVAGASLASSPLALEQPVARDSA